MGASKYLRISVLLVGASIYGCASITAIPLKPDGSKQDNVVDGIRYYLPKPYLLVTELPEEPQSQQSQASGTTPTGGGSGNGANASQSQGSNSGQGSGSSTSPSSAAPSSGTQDTSFSASTTSYSLKLIYLPDMAHPMALQSSSGLFGTVSVGPSLQDGWMLTSVNGSVDSGASATLSALASIISAKASPSGGGTTGTQSKTGGGAPVSAASLTTAGFTPAQAALLTQMLNSAKPATQAASWGPGVLRPGLYEFRFDGNGAFQGFFPVALFCGSGVIQPSVDTNDKTAQTQAQTSATCNAMPR